MQNLTELELQNLRHLIMAHETVEQKWSDYAQSCTTPEIKQFLEQGASNAKSTKDNLMGYLS